MTTRKRLPIGIQNFGKIRGDNFYYVDKTQGMYELIQGGEYYFLSRPRRFGKSLLIDTFKELFEANEPLFRGLAVHEHWDWHRSYPVIIISFGKGVLQSRTELDVRIRDILQGNQQNLGISCLNSDDVAGCFSEMIRKAHETFGQRVVVLVDEYDKPILDNITNSDIALEMREGLKNFYSVIKDSDAHIRFAFLTGVSKFNKVSLFSGLNNLTDITLDRRYATICGYTDTDVDTVFAPELTGLDREEIRRWYNGYNWLGEGVYNPFDLLQTFDKRELRPYWFETGTPTFLIKLLTDGRPFTPSLELVHSTETLLSAFDVGNMPVETLMFQTGYLTIKHSRYRPGALDIQLGYPNLEVQTSLNEHLLTWLTHTTSAHAANRSRLYDVLLARDFEAMGTLFQSFYASIPHDWYRKNQLAQYEGYYASVFYSYFAALGIGARLEDSTNLGRVDLTADFDGHIFLFEFKVVELLPEGKAIEQLKARRYADKYRASGKPIHLIGVEFSKETRNIVAFDVESLN